MENVIICRNFPTHSPKSKSGTKWLKINGNTLYSGIHHRVRSHIVNYMKDYISGEIPEGFKLDKSIFPATLTIIFCVPPNFGNISLRGGVLKWKSPEKDFVPNWDLDNQWIWTKTGIDAIKHLFPSGDDNVSQLNGIEVLYYPVPHFDDRKIIYLFTPTKTNRITSLLTKIGEKV